LRGHRLRTRGIGAISLSYALAKTLGRVY
jgi:hypothetical protein